MFLAFLLFISIGPALYTGWRVEGLWAWSLAQREYKENKNNPYHCWDLSDGDGIPNGFAHFYGFLMGLLTAVFWPIVAICLVLKTTHRISGGGLTYTPKEIRLKQQKDRIKALEDELNLTR